MISISLCRHHLFCYICLDLFNRFELENDIISKKQTQRILIQISTRELLIDKRYLANFFANSLDHNVAMMMSFILQNSKFKLKRSITFNMTNNSARNKLQPSENFRFPKIDVIILISISRNDLHLPNI